jgi:NDP-sugar pyrophosphorylase family protein
MKAMILAAGLGTRLRPVTEKIPKALVKVNGRTLLETAILHLRESGIREIILNVHHLAGQIIDFLGENGNFGVQLAISDETGLLLDTGGGLKKAEWFFRDGNPFVVRNVDVLSDMDLGKMVEFHREKKALVTLAVRDRKTSRYFLFDRQTRLLCGWENRDTGEQIHAGPGDPGPVRLAFSGIQVVDPAIFPLITEEGRFSLTPVYLRLAREQRIIGYEDNRSAWQDAGKSLKDIDA